MITGNNYKYVDPAYINEMADGDVDFILQVLGLYLETIPEVISKLQGATTNTDYAAIIFCTHKLRGSFNFIGGAQMIHTLDKIDELCNAQTDLPTIRQLTGEVVTIAKEIILELKEIMEQVKKLKE